MEGGSENGGRGWEMEEGWKMVAGVGKLREGPGKGCKMVVKARK